MRLALVLVLVLFAVSGCGSAVQLAPEASSRAGKTFSAPPPDLAAVYVFTTPKAGTTWALAIDQRDLGMMENTQWLRVDVKPGKRDLRCSSVILRDPPARVALDLAPGSISYVVASYVPLGNPSCKLQVTSADYAQPLINAGSRVQEYGGASD